MTEFEQASYRRLIADAKVTGWDRESINALLMVCDTAVERAITALYARQTEDERDAQATTHANGMGFSGSDAEFYSSLAERLRSHGRLTPAQIAACRRPYGKTPYCRLARYSRQLCEIANAPREAVALAA